MATNGARGFTLATKITVTRMLLSPIFVICLVYQRSGLALLVFIIASLADAVDGHLARRRGEMTALGAMLDPIADKLLMFSAYIVMGANGQIPLWLSVVVVSRDVLICVGCLTLFMTVGFITPAPSLLGKSTTAAQMITVIAALTASAGGAKTSIAPLALFVLTGGLTIASGLHYIFFGGARMMSQRGAPAAGAGEERPSGQAAER